MLLTIRCCSDELDAWYTIFDRTSPVFIKIKEIRVNFSSTTKTDSYCEAITEAWRMIYPEYKTIVGDVFILK